MALGENIGYSMRLTMENAGLYETGNCARYVSAALMGDPTLRLHTVAPPSGFSTSFNQTMVSMSWTHSQDSIAGYTVYRKNKTTGVYQRINNAVINTASWTDSFPANATNYYMLRAVKLEISNSGSYYNLSQGVFDSTVTDIATGEIFAEAEVMKVFPNPSDGVFNIALKGFETTRLRVCIANIHGQIILCEDWNPENGNVLKQIVLSAKPRGVYFIHLSSGKYNKTERLIVK
jgi:hypothetical protein